MSAYLRVYDGIVSLVHEKKAMARISEDEFVQKIVKYHSPPEDFFPIPEGVRMYVFAGSYAVLAVELAPGLHTFRWIKDVSEWKKAAHIGSNAEYEERTLALPYAILILPFSQGILQTSICQVFYRTAPLSGWDDELFRTNLLNVANGYGFTNWLCMVGYTQQQGLLWIQAVEEAVRYFYWSAFNRSSEVHEKNSHYSTAREQQLDVRISSVAEWEKASQQDPRFMLQIPWLKSGHTVRSALKLSFEKMKSQKGLNLINLVRQ